MALAIESKDFDKELRRVWLQAACAALEGGSLEAVTRADEVMLDYDARFGEQSEAKTSGTFRLDLAVKYFERNALVGKQVMRVGRTDVPEVGVIRDFGEPMPGVPVGSALILWSSADASPDGEWMLTNQLQLIAFPPIIWEPKV